MNSDFKEFKSYCALAHQLMDAMTPEHLRECLQVMAIHLADYRSRFGEIQRENPLELLGVTEISDDHARLLRDSMELLVGYLAMVHDGGEKEGAPIH